MSSGAGSDQGQCVCTHLSGYQEQVENQKKKKKVLFAETPVWDFGGSVMLEGGAREPCLPLELRDSSLPRAFCLVLHPLPSPQHQLHCLGTEERKAQPGEFRDGGGARSEGDGEGWRWGDASSARV